MAMRGRSVSLTRYHPACPITNWSHFMSGDVGPTRSVLLAEDTVHPLFSSDSSPVIAGS